MTQKMAIGRLCEYLVKVFIESKTGYVVENVNDRKRNNPVTDLIVTNPSTDETYWVSVKAKIGDTWPSVCGIHAKDQYIVFVDLQPQADPALYILNNRQWSAVLRKVLPYRDRGGEIVKGAIEWNWKRDGKTMRRRGSFLTSDDIGKYKNAWHILPGVGLA